MKKLSFFEAHVSIDRENATLMIKVFIFVYINMAFTVLIAFGYIPNVPYGLQVVGIFQGQYSDFTSDWYASTGAVDDMHACIYPRIICIYIHFMESIDCHA